MTEFDRKLSHTSMAAFRRCPQRYKWNYVDNYDPLPSYGQMFGGVGHAALGSWYKAISDGDAQDSSVDKSFQSASEKLRSYEERFGYEMPDLWDDISTVLFRYYDWALQNDDFVSVPNGIEHKFEIKIGEFIVIGYIDGIVERDNGSLWILEHKFNKQVQTGHLELDPQVSIYMLAARASGYDVRGALYNVVRTTITGKAEKDPVVRLPVFRNNEGLEHIVHELAWQMKDMKDFHLRNGKFAYRNQTRDCSWDCGFYHACLALNDTGDATPALNIIPLKEFEKDKEDSLEGE